MSPDNEPRKIQPVQLANGTFVPDVLVTTTMIVLRDLVDNDAISFYELAMKCRDASHPFWGSTEETLKKAALIEENGEIHDSIKNIVLSAVKGDELEMTLGSPFPEQDSKS